MDPHVFGIAAILLCQLLVAAVELVDTLLERLELVDLDYHFIGSHFLDIHLLEFLPQFIDEVYIFGIFGVTVGCCRSVCAAQIALELIGNLHLAFADILEMELYLIKKDVHGARGHVSELERFLVVDEANTVIDFIKQLMCLFKVELAIELFVAHQLCNVAQLLIADEGSAQLIEILFVVDRSNFRLELHHIAGGVREQDIANARQISFYLFGTLEEAAVVFHGAAIFFGELPQIDAVCLVVLFGYIGKVHHVSECHVVVGTVHAREGLQEIVGLDLSAEI